MRDIRSYIEFRKGIAQKAEISNEIEMFEYIDSTLGNALRATSILCKALTDIAVHDPGGFGVDAIRAIKESWEKLGPEENRVKASTARKWCIENNVSELMMDLSWRRTLRTIEGYRAMSESGGTWLSLPPYLLSKIHYGEE